MIQLKFYKIFPVIFIYTNCCIPERFAGYNVGFINFIRPEYKEMKCLINHEFRHSKQFYQNPIKYCLGRWLKYFKFLPKSIIKWSEQKTAEFECEAYAEQIVCLLNLNSYYDIHSLVEEFTDFVYTKYNIKSLSRFEIKKILLSYLKKYLNN
jgi:hypothetical protein